MKLISQPCSQKVDDCFNDALEGLLREATDLRYHETAASGEQLARTGIARHPEGARIKVSIRKGYGTRVCVRIAGDLAQNPVIPARVSQH